MKTKVPLQLTKSITYWASRKIFKTKGKKSTLVVVYIWGLLYFKRKQRQRSNKVIQSINGKQLVFLLS